MRRAFIETLIERAEVDDRVFLLTGDLGFSVVEPFAEAFPNRFLNVGVAEQNMVGVATGLASAGMRPYVYSIVTFASLRPFEFIRNGPVLHQLPVRVVGVGGGFEYGHAGPTHHGLEDIAIMRSLPGLMVLTPADPSQTAAAVRATAEHPGPIYFRIGKNDQQVVDGLDGRFRLGHVEQIRDGNDIAIFGMGASAVPALEAARLLGHSGTKSSVFVVGSIEPSPSNDLREILDRFPLAVSVEAHSVKGGLGSLLAEVCADHGLGTRVLRCGVRERQELGGSEGYLHARHHLTPDAIAEAIQHVLVAGARR